MDYKTTACDYNLRELEIDTASQYMRDGDRVLDVGCGLGYAAVQYASRHAAEVQGIDYAENMILGAQRLLAENEPTLKGTVSFTHASVCSLPFPPDHFDVVSSSRCLMALLDWKLQQDALVDIHRVLKPGGRLVLMEGTIDGLTRLNHVREKFGLEKIDADGRDRLFTRKFREQELLAFCSPLYHLEATWRFGMYYFLTRVVHPLLVAPEKPKYDARINAVAREIARIIPDYDGLGHLVAFVLQRKP
ncbi:MAG: hypothetical protein A2V70_02120 [Planctomycetes bacterium RBG_13_63_9]|nr:MAG: hypothetical protein A2V70_02120 [Planctomycetes bacterium RBG_13_63_9]